MVTSVARSRWSCVLGDHGYAVPYRAYILAVSENIRHNMMQVGRALDRYKDERARVNRAGFYRAANDVCVNLPHRRPRHDCYPLNVAAFSRARCRSDGIGSARSEPLQSRAARLL